MKNEALGAGLVESKLVVFGDPLHLFVCHEHGAGPGLVASLPKHAPSRPSR